MSDYHDTDSAGHGNLYEAELALQRIHRIVWPAERLENLHRYTDMTTNTDTTSNLKCGPGGVPHQYLVHRWRG